MCIHPNIHIDKLTFHHLKWCDSCGNDLFISNGTQLLIPYQQIELGCDKNTQGLHFNWEYLAKIDAILGILVHFVQLGMVYNIS